MAIRGQHLRLFLDDKAIAAATSCTVEVTADVSDASTKDSDDGWTENVVTGLSWSASAEAVVFEYSSDYIDFITLENLPYRSSTDVNYKYPCLTPIALKAGETLTANAGYYTSIVTGDITSGYPTEVAYNTGTPGQSLTYTATEDITVYIVGCFTSKCDTTKEVTYSLSDDDGTYLKDFITSLKNSATVTAKLQITDGTKNREVESRYPILSGTAYISSINVTAQNRNFITASVQLTGTGEPTFTDLEDTSADISTLSLDDDGAQSEADDADTTAEESDNS